jgi:methylase of polypeptide subunit release factors
MSNRSDAWTSDQAYEPYVGRRSRLVAPRFLQWLPPAQPSALWCDVGSGTGVLAHSILASEQPARVLGSTPRRRISPRPSRARGTSRSRL